MLAFDPEKVTQEDIVYLFFMSKGIDISEEFYEFVNFKKVRNTAINEDFKELVINGHNKMSIYSDLAYRYKVSVTNIRMIVS